MIVGRALGGEAIGDDALFDDRHPIYALPKRKSINASFVRGLRGRAQSS
jgi:hypothetical protein